MRRLIKQQAAAGSSRQQPAPRLLLIFQRKQRSSSFTRIPLDAALGGFFNAMSDHEELQRLAPSFSEDAEASGSDGSVSIDSCLSAIGIGPLQWSVRRSLVTSMFAHCRCLQVHRARCGTSERFGQHRNPDGQ
jgi:hypothetical protein